MPQNALREMYRVPTTKSVVSKDVHSRFNVRDLKRGRTSVKQFNVRSLTVDGNIKTDHHETSPRVHGVLANSNYILS